MFKRIATILVTSALAMLVSAPVFATGTPGTAITACDPYRGGVKFFNLDNQQGTDRVFCSSGGLNTWTNDGSFESGNSGALNDVSNFDNKANSARIRVTAQCSADLYLYTGNNFTGTSYLRVIDNLTNSPMSLDIDFPNDVISSAKLHVFCD